MSCKSASTDAVKDGIINAAIEEFNARPFGLVRMRRIADRAGINHSMLYYYFGSKERLYEAAMREMRARWRRSNAQLGERISDIAGAGDRKSSKELIADILSERIALPDSSGGKVRRGGRAVRERCGGVFGMTQNSFVMFYQNLARLVGAASAGKLSDFECLMAARMFAGLIFSPDGMGIAGTFNGTEQKKAVRKFVSRILDGLLS